MIAAGSSPWPARHPPAGCTRAARGCCHRPSPRRRPTGPWTPWPRLPKPRASRSPAARSAASSSANGCAGDRPARGPPAPTLTSPQQGQGHRPLHHPARGDDGDLRRRARPGHPPQLPARTGLVEQATPAGTIMVITDNLPSHTSYSTRTWLVDHPRIQHAFIPKRACWLNLQEGWWRLFGREALAGETFATPSEITLATAVATC